MSAPHPSPARLRPRQLVRAVVVLLTLVLVTACSSAVDDLKKSSGERQEGGVLRVGALNDIIPARIFTNSSDSINLLIGNVYDSLIDYPLDKLEPKPSLATSWKFSADGKQLTAFRFAEGGDVSRFYDGEGNSLKRAFLRAPVEFRRISSNFSRARFHPVLGRTRKHEGTDYAASTGTAVVSAGEGTVIRAGRAGGYGNLVEIRHKRGYSTRYAHLRGFRSGIVGHHKRRFADQRAELFQLRGDQADVNRGRRTQTVEIAIDGLLQRGETRTVGTCQLRLRRFERNDGVGDIAAQLQLLLRNGDQMIDVVDQDQI